MRKVCFIILLSMLTILPCASQNTDTPMQKEEKAPVVFVYHIPDDEDSSGKEVSNKNVEKTFEITSDDVTADTSLENQKEEDELANNDSENDINNDSEEYGINDLYSDVLQGYAAYNEGEEDEITLDSQVPLLHIDIKPPTRIGGVNYTQLKTTPLKFYDNSYSKFYIPEFRIVPISSSNTAQLGVVKIGTTYNEYIDYGELEQTSGVFSKYQYKNFSIKTSYTKTINSTNNNYNDKFFLSPEFKINQYFTLVNNFSADLTKRNKKAEIMLSINPLGNKDPDFMRIDIGANQTYSEISNTFKSQFHFATRFNF